ncbi:MAG TPA: alpha/beta hydrolase [Sphingopyxis sp.]|nr:alpha/beta hydrolase [Sphingopyxis sp.]HMP45722.1 alpha/beta hydrolase [Sphingopyxis sp.]HMQ20279.1 alpha/beta hydrolase [Sphingopyxis sp.]
MYGRLTAAALAAAALTFAQPAAAASEGCGSGILDGKRVTILVEGDGPDVVLIPGLSTPRAVWDATAERLKNRYRLHRVQIRGFGDDAGINAEGPVLDPMMKEVADYIDDCITDTGRPAPAVIGHSMGGLTGLMIAARAPGEVGKLMIVDAVPFIGTIFFPGATVDMMKPHAEAMAAAMRGQMDRGWPEGPITDPGEASPMGRMSNSAAGRIQVSEWTRTADSRVTAQVFYEVMTTDMRGGLPAVQAPVTLLYAQDDTVMPAAMAKAAFEPQYAGTPRFEARMVSGSRHFIMIDQPEAFAAAVEAFLAE